VCRFGTVVVRPAVVQSATGMSCITPAMAPGMPRPVSVSNNAADYSDTSTTPVGAQLTVMAGPMLVNAVPQDGSTMAVYTANPLPSPAPQFVCLYGMQSSSATLLNDRRSLLSSPATPAAFCAFPALGVGFVTVELGLAAAAQGGPSAAAWGATGNVEPLQFEFLPAPEARLAMPNAATRGGGTLISISGRDFGVGVGGGASDVFPNSVRFGDAGPVAQARVVSSVLITVEAPAAAVPDAAPLAAGRFDGVFPAGAHQAPFTYVSDVRLFSVAPQGGSVLGGTAVYMSGAGFSSGDPQFCRFGTLGPVIGDFISDVTVRCTSPAHAAGDPVPVAAARANALDLAFSDGVNFEY
jgi:hypothetical protein